MITGQYIILKGDNFDKDFYYWISYGIKNGKPKMEYGEDKINKPNFTITMDWNSTVATWTRRMRGSLLATNGIIKLSGNRMLADNWGHICWNMAIEVAKLLGKEFKGNNKQGWWDSLDVDPEFIDEKRFFDALIYEIEDEE